MARWLLNLLKEAGTGATAGSTRAAAATWAMAHGISMETIMTAADWTKRRFNGSLLLFPFWWAHRLLNLELGLTTRQMGDNLLLMSYVRLTKTTRY